MHGKHYITCSSPETTLKKEQKKVEEKSVWAMVCGLRRKMYDLPSKMEVLAWSAKTQVEMFKCEDHIMGVQGVVHHGSGSTPPLLLPPSGMKPCIIEILIGRRVHVTIHDLGNTYTDHHKCDKAMDLGECYLFRNPFPSTTMGDADPIRTLGYYSKPSHEGYKNTIELPVGNNEVPLRSDTIRLVQNGCSFYELRFKDPNQDLKDLLKLVDSLDLDGENRERTQDLALYDNESWNNPRDFAKPVKAISLPQDVPSTSDRRLIELENQVQRLMEAHLAPTQPTQENKITTSCEICSGPYDTQYCMEYPEQAFIECASSETNETGERNVKTSTTKYEDHEMTMESEEESKEETGDEIKEEEEEDSPKHFDTFPTMKKLRCHGWLLKNPRPPWVKAKQAYIDMKSPINVMSMLHYNWIMSKRLGSRRKPSKPGKIYNFIGRVKGIKVFIGNFTYECNFMVLEDTTSVIDHDLGSVIFGKPFIEATALVYDREEGTITFKK
nr:gamma-glutamyl peptidase 5 [Tanacetum cinerariifolium]